MVSSSVRDRRSLLKSVRTVLLKLGQIYNRVWQLPGKAENDGTPEKRDWLQQWAHDYEKSLRSAKSGNEITKEEVDQHTTFAKKLFERNNSSETDLRHVLHAAIFSEGSFVGGRRECGLGGIDFRRLINAIVATFVYSMEVSSLKEGEPGGVITGFFLKYFFPDADDDMIKKVKDLLYASVNGPAHGDEQKS